MTPIRLRHPPYQLPVLPIAGEARQFPVRQTYCTGLSYAAHALEMGRDPAQDPPFFFMKCVDAVARAEDPLECPPMSRNVQLEVELVVAIGKETRDVRVEDALGHVFGYAIGLDVTRRDLELAARRCGRPWEFGKSFRGSAVIGPIHAVDRVGHPERGAIWLDRNGDPMQRGDLSQLVWSVAEQIAFLSSYYTLHEGDLLMTGTPAGISAVHPGDRFLAGIAALGEISLQVHDGLHPISLFNLESCHE